MGPLGGRASGPGRGGHRALVMTRLPEVLDEFPDAYDDPYNVDGPRLPARPGHPRQRPRVAGGAARPARVRGAARRVDRDGPGVGDPTIDATDPDGRAEVAVAEFAECGGGGAATIRRSGGGATRDRGGALARRAGRDLARRPRSCWPTGTDRHDVLHRAGGADRASRIRAWRCHRRRQSSGGPFAMSGRASDWLSTGRRCCRRRRGRC